MTAGPSEPYVWRAGWPARVAAAGACLLFVVLAERPHGGTPADPRPGAVFFAVWTSLVVGWLCCRVGLWRTTADRDGAHIRRMWAVTFLPWSEIGRAELRRDGLLEFVGRRRLRWRVCPRRHGPTGWRVVEELESERHGC